MELYHRLILSIKHAECTVTAFLICKRTWNTASKARSGFGNKRSMAWNTSRVYLQMRPDQLTIANFYFGVSAQILFYICGGQVTCRCGYNPLILDPVLYSSMECAFHFFIPYSVQQDGLYLIWSVLPLVPRLQRHLAGIGAHHCCLTIGVAVSGNQGCRWFFQRPCCLQHPAANYFTAYNVSDNWDI